CWFFVQAEDGIRDRNVTGVQTCALPISGGTSSGTGCRVREGLAPRSLKPLNIAVPIKIIKAPTRITASTAAQPHPLTRGRRILSVTPGILHSSETLP